jgi:hypothetical protein
MFTFIYDSENKNNSATLYFKNDILEMSCSPENIVDLEDDGYNSAPSNGEFMFYYDEENISFRVEKYGERRGGNINISFRMTKKIRESLEIALNEWRQLIERKSEEDSEEYVEIDEEMKW